MKNTCVCDQEVTPQMVRQGAVISRGGRLICRACPEAASHRAAPRMRSWDSDAAEGVRIAEYASFWRRVGSHVIDSFILNVVVMLGSVLFSLGAGAFGVVEPTLLTILGGLIGAIVPLGYCVWFWAKRGATPGKIALGIRIVGDGNAELTTGQSIVRYLGYIPSGLLLGLGYLWMLWDDENRCWHDKMAGTYVIRV